MTTGATGVTIAPYSATNPFNLWSLRKSIGVMRDVLPRFTYWLDMFNRQVNSIDEWIDFEKLPYQNRKLAPFVLPSGSGKPVYTDRANGYRFKPAYIKVKDAVDPARVMSKIPGIDAILGTDTPLTPAQRRDALKAGMTAQHLITIQRRWEWMAAQAIIYGQVTIGGTEEYPLTTVNFGRNANQSVALTAGSFWGTSGISILSMLQTWADQMMKPTYNSDGTGGFGGFPIRLTVGTSAWQAMRSDPEILSMMNKFYPNTGIDVQRALVSGEFVTKVGDLPFGGPTGAVVEIWLYRDSYVDDTGVEQPFLAPTDIVLTGHPDAISGHRCFGAIVDPYANWQALDIFPRNWYEPGDPAVEYLLHQSAPLFVPVNPNATFRATVTAS